MLAIHAYVQLVLHVFRLLLDLLATRSLSDQQKDLEILVLRHQLRILKRKLPRSPRVSVWDKGVLAVLAVQFRACSKRTGRNLEEAILLFRPDTALRWHRELVRRKWTFPQDKRIGRPSVAVELEQLIVRLAQENPRRGYSKIQGELLKLGYSVSRSSIRNVLKHHHIPPSAQRERKGSRYWRVEMAEPLAPDPLPREDRENSEEHRAKEDQQFHSDAPPLVLRLFLHKWWLNLPMAVLFVAVMGGIIFWLSQFMPGYLVVLFLLLVGLILWVCLLGLPVGQKRGLVKDWVKLIVFFAFLLSSMLSRTCSHTLQQHRDSSWGNWFALGSVLAIVTIIMLLVFFPLSRGKSK